MASSNRRFRWVVTLGAIALITVPLVSCSDASRSEYAKSALDFPPEDPSADGAKNPQERRRNTEELDPLSIQPPIPPVGAYLGGISPGVFSQLKYLPLMAPAYIPEGFLLVKHDVPDKGYSLVYRRAAADQCFAIEHVSAEEDSTTADFETSADTDIITEESRSELSPFVVLVPDTLDFKAFDSPVFGPSQKLFHGKAAQLIASEELARATPEADLEPSSEAASEKIVSPASGSTAQGLPAQLSEKTPGSPNSEPLVSQWLQNDQGFYRYLTGAIVTQNHPAQMPCGSVSLEESVKIVTSLTDLTAESGNSITEISLSATGTPDSRQTSGN